MIRRRRSEPTPPQYYGEPPSSFHAARAHVVVCFILLIFTIISFRLCFVHLTPRNELTQEELLHIGQVELRQPRGQIRDSSGLVLATDRQVPSLWVDPRKVKDPEQLARLLAGPLDMKQNDLLEKFNEHDGNGNIRKFVWVKRWLTDLNEDVLEKLVEQSDGALTLQDEPIRFYPQGDTAAHLLGFVNRAGEASEGLELYANDHLRSVSGKKLARKDGKRELLDSLTLEYSDPKGGEDVYLTLDMTLQHSLEEKLDARVKECNASGAMGLVMDPYTGAILAMATRPAYDPNHYDDYPAALRKNRALVDVFEPGSCFKIVTASAALEHKLLTIDTMINCEGGSFNPYGHTIKDFHKLYVEPFSHCFAESSNIAMIKVGAMLGPERLDNWIRTYRFGQVTSHDFAKVESKGIYRSRDKWSRLTMGSLPMGQEISVTMPQLARAFSVIANGGYLVEPYFMEKAVSRTGEVTYQHTAPPAPRILSKETVDTMRWLCHQVVLHGTGEPASIDEYKVGGKTGTAQIASKNGRGYIPGHFTAVFAGFAPVSDPRLVAVIVVSEPLIKLHFGGPVSGPVFRDVVREALIRMNVPQEPSEDELIAKAHAGERQKKAAEDKLARAKAKDLEKKEKSKAKAKGKNKKKDQEEAKIELAAVEEDDADSEENDADSVAYVNPAEMDDSPLALLAPLDPLELVARAKDKRNTKKMPDVTGMNKRQVWEVLASAGIPWDAQGAGWVVTQDPAPGAPMNEQAVCKLEFANKHVSAENDVSRNM